MSKGLLSCLVPLLMAGCASGPKYACGLPEGVGCKPVSEVYAASVSGTLVRGRPKQDADDKEDNTGNTGQPLVKASDAAPVVATVQPGDPLLTRPKQIRVWINRWEDDTGDLHDETYLYLRLDNGSWRLGQ